MDIKEVTIRVQTSKQYQVYETTITATNLSGNDIESIKQTAIAQSVSGLNLLCNSMGLSSTEQPKVENTVSTSQDDVKTPSYMKTPTNGPSVGETRQFPNKSGHTTAYTLKYSKTKDEYFWLISNEESMKYGFPKYIKYEG